MLAFVGAFSRTTDTPWWALVLIGIVSIGAAVVAFVYPGLTAVGLLYVIATGVLAIVAAIQLRRAIEGEFWLGLAGALSILFGAFLMARPGIGVLAVVRMIGTYTVVFGVVLVALGLRVKSVAAYAA